MTDSGGPAGGDRAVIALKTSGIGRSAAPSNNIFEKAKKKEKKKIGGRKRSRLVNKAGIQCWSSDASPRLRISTPFKFQFKVSRGFMSSSVHSPLYRQPIVPRLTRSARTFISPSLFSIPPALSRPSHMLPVLPPVPSLPAVPQVSSCGGVEMLRVNNLGMGRSPLLAEDGKKKKEKKNLLNNSSWLPESEKLFSPGACARVFMGEVR